MLGHKTRILRWFDFLAKNGTLLVTVYPAYTMKKILASLKYSLGIESFAPSAVWASFREKFAGDSLFQNSVYLIMSTAVQSALGFLFWILAARLYTSDDIGIATALISATLLLTNFSLLGFNNSFIRYIPKAKNPSTIVNTGIIAVAVAALLVGTGYVLGIGHFSDELGFLADQRMFAVLFVLITTLEAVNSLTDSVFIAKRASRFNLIIYTSFSVVKVVALVSLVSLASYGVFFAYVGAVIVALLLSLYFIRKTFGYQLAWRFDRSAARTMAKFSFANYISTFATALPVQVFPIMIVSYLGASHAAYFYIASMIANMIYVVPTATSQSMFAEGSHAEEELAAHTKGALKVTALVCVPIIIGVVLFGQLILKIFGGDYSAEAYRILLIFTLTTPLVSFFFIGNTVLNVKHRIRPLVGISIAFAIIAIGSAYLMRGLGTAGFAYGLLVSYFVCCIYLFGQVRRALTA